MVYGPQTMDLENENFQTATRALILMKVAKVKHLFYPKKLMSAVGERSSHRKGQKLMFQTIWDRKQVQSCEQFFSHFKMLRPRII